MAQTKDTSSTGSKRFWSAVPFCVLSITLLLLPADHIRATLKLVNEIIGEYGIPILFFSLLFCLFEFRRKA